MKKLNVAIVLVFCLICVVVARAIFLSSIQKGSYQYRSLPITVRYMTNIEGETLTLTSGREATAENTVFQMSTSNTGDKLVPPETEPTRIGYTFSGWAVDKEGEILYDFDQPISGGINLYAKWVRVDGAAEISLDYTEPSLSFKEQISEELPFTLTGVCNQFISDGVVDLTTVGIKRLTDHASDVSAYLNYTRAQSTVINSATYSGNAVHVTYTVAGVATPTEVTVTVNDVTAERVVKDKNASDDALKSFENKAQAYESSEETDIEPYNVIMGGSSSMENWRTSVEDMAPVTTKNVGIGGTTAYHWRNYLADRLIIPYSPRAVVLYVGINDIINFGKTGKATGNSLIGLFEYIHERLPETTIHFILINHVPGYYKAYKNYIDTANNMVIEFAESNSYLNIIDAGTVLEKKNGEYSEAYFMPDKLHMSEAGYVLWGAEVKKAVIAKDKELYDND